MVDEQLHTSRLVADGPYRYVRNPLYFGNILLEIGLGLMASRTGFVILVLGMILFDYRLILREELELVVSLPIEIRTKAHDDTFALLRKSLNLYTITRRSDKMESPLSYPWAAEWPLCAVRPLPSDPRRST